ncbi:magnesium-dependent phosphatase-1 [Serendipita vermifera]|nr:magnesium-dependent phosphatase-1 [Serendipita vermifera]
MANSERLPQLVAFDLDYTLWDMWIDTHATGPLRRSGDKLNQVLDRYGEEISFYPEIAYILHAIEDKTTLALCSRTCAPDLAREALRLLLVPPKPGEEAKRAIDYFPQKEIYPGSKIKHFKALHQKTGIPYSEMLFFDDESRNAEVELLGVTFVLVRHGTDQKTFWKGVEKWRARQKSLEDEEDAEVNTVS